MSNDDRQGICVVTAGGPYPWIIVNALGRRFGPIDVVQEEPEPTLFFLRRRANKMGWVSVAGQLCTMVFVRLGKRILAVRSARMTAMEEIETEPLPQHSVTHVPSVNAETFVTEIRRIQPRVILLAGCRIVKGDILSRIDCPVLNYHAGITPQYRGMNGGYWALAEGDALNFGATVHLVDNGVDTGAVIAQRRGLPAPGDNIMTYALRLALMSQEMCADAVSDALAGKLSPIVLEAPSRQWYHPTIWAYLWTGIKRGVW
ncbi:MAG: formyl transferase [Pseudomonadota bacterium]|nr:formyl transferase [Pseudomonadota bacterium]